MPRSRRIGCRCRRVEEVLVEQFGPAHDQEHDADAERERSGEPGHIAEARFNQRLDDTECDHSENDREPGDEAGRDQFEERLLQPTVAFLDRSIEYLRRVGSGRFGHGPCIGGGGKNASVGPLSKTGATIAFGSTAGFRRSRA